VPTRPCFGLTSDTARAIVEFGRVFRRSGDTRLGGVARLSCCSRTAVRFIARAPYYLRSYMRARRFLRASEVRLLACERDLISFARTLNREGRSVARAPHYVARNVCCVDVRTLPCRQRVDGCGSMVAERGSMIAGGRVACERPLACERVLLSCARTLNLKGHSVARAPHYVARNVCCVNVRTFPCHQRVDGRGSRFRR
jgi:hypothetical protein